MVFAAGIMKALSPKYGRDSGSFKRNISGNTDEDNSNSDSHQSTDGMGKSLLPNEGEVGTYEELIDAGTRGDNLTPHHMPSAKYMDSNAGVHKNDGISMNMEQPTPGSGGRHRQTETYGLTGQGLSDYLKLSPRNALARDIWDARKIYKADGLYTPEIRESLQKVIGMNKDSYTDLFKK